MRSFITLMMAAIIVVLLAVIVGYGMVNYKVIPGLINTPEVAETVAKIAPLPPSPVLSDEQVVAVEATVRKLLTEKEPEIIITAAKAVQEKRSQEATEQGKKSLGENRNQIFTDPSSPVGGNPEGDVTVVEFFDYQCGYCKMAQEAVAKLLEADKSVRFVYKEFPILSDTSTLISKLALASAKQGKYEKFHVALMTTKEQLSEDVVYKIASDVGLDVAQLKKDAESPEIAKAIADNISLGGMLGARGTPTFVIGEDLFPGAMDYNQLQDAVMAARKNRKN